MRLLAALVPPPAELDRLREAAADVAPVPEKSTGPQPEGRHRAGSRRWFGRQHTEEPEPPTVPTGPMLTLVHPDAMRVPVIKFGNLSNTDSIRLADQLEQRAPEWPAPRLRLTGAFLLRPEGRPPTLWAGMSGDIDEVRELIRGVAHVAQGMQMFVDRRIFRPEIQLGAATEHATPGYLKALIAELDDFESNAWWQTTLSLQIPVDERLVPEPFKTFREIALGPAVAH